MVLELLTTRGSDRLTCRGHGLCSIGEAVAELMARYDFALGRDLAGRDLAGRDLAGRDLAGREFAGRDFAEADGPDPDPEAEFAFATCDPIGCA